MAETSEEEVRRIAALARLEVSAEELAALSSQLERILQQFERLAELDVEGVEPTLSPRRAQDVRRPDVPRPGLTAADVLAGAPAREDGFFAVPRAFGEGEADGGSEGGGGDAAGRGEGRPR